MKSAPVTLAWDPANDQSVGGYGIYYGLTTQPVTNYINVGTNLTVTLFDLLANSNYQFYAVSYNAAGNESVPSNPLLLTLPVMSPVRITRLATGDFRLALRAAPGTVCQVEYADTPNSSIWQTLSLATADANGDVVVVDPLSSQRASRFYRVARLGNPPPFTRLQLAKQANNSMQITLNGSPGTTWGIQFAPSPFGSEWTTLTLVTANATGNAVVIDPDSAQRPSRFYRAVLLLNPPPFTRLQGMRNSDGLMVITLNGSPGNTWNIQYAPSPASAQWTTFATVTANTTGEASVTNSPPANVASRFYRAWLK